MYRSVLLAEKREKNSVSSVSSVVKYKFPFSKEVCRNKLKSHYFAHFSAEMNETVQK